MISRHTACRPPPPPYVHMEIKPANKTLAVSPLVQQIKQRITYDSKWSQSQIDETVSYLVRSLSIDDSKEKYPIKLDDIAKLLEYKTFQGLEVLLLEHFKDKIDYSLLTLKQRIIGKVKKGGRSKKNYVLTAACAKQLCMMSNTKKAKGFRMYFIIIADLLKDIIKDSENKLVEVVRTTIADNIAGNKKQEPSLIQKFEEIKLEVDLEYEYKDKSVIYFHKLNSESEYDIYKWGITYRIEQRGGEHKKRFGNTTLIDVIDIDHLTYKQGFNLETSIRTICKKLGIYFPYENSNETLRVKKTDNVNVVIDYVKEQSKKLINMALYLPDIVTANPPHRKESVCDYKDRLDGLNGAPIKVKTFNYLMVDNDYDDFLIAGS
jgi:phage anti-repressor protein